MLLLFDMLNDAMGDIGNGPPADINAIYLFDRFCVIRSGHSAAIHA